MDGFEGAIYVEPVKEVLDKKEAIRQEELKKRELLQTLKGKENVTLDGQKINLYANIGSLSDVASVLQNDAGGIGLFRSEFLYLENSDYPQRKSSSRYISRLLKIWAERK